MTDTFDAVLAEMRRGGGTETGWIGINTARQWADRLSATHAAEVAERDARIAKLQELAGCAYQLAGWHDAPEAWLDALSDAASGIPLAEWRVQGDLIETLLPYAPDTESPYLALDRAEAAERDARELRAILYEAVGDDAKDWESGDGWPMGRFLVPALAGDYATAASEFAAYNAERAAIATTEQADED